MIPEVTDPRWKAAVVGDPPPRFKTLVARLVLTRARLLALDTQTVDDAVELLHAYFAANQTTTAEELAQVLTLEQHR